MAKLRIGVWWASITWGAWDLEKWGRVARLRDYFDHTTPAFVYNLGVSGANTHDLLERFEIEAKARRPDIIVFSIWVNDAHMYEGKSMTSLVEFQKNVRQLIILARQFTDTIVFMGISRVDESRTMPWRPEEWKYYSNATAQEYSTVLKQICRDEKLFFLDIFDTLDLQDLPDGIHPNAQWHEKIYQKVKLFLQENNLM